MTIYIRHRASKAHRACLIHVKSCKPLGKKGSKILFFRGKHPPVNNSLLNLFLPFFQASFRTSIFEPKGSKTPPRGSPEMLKSSKMFKKIGSKFRPRNRAWKKEVQSVSIVLPSTFWLDFQGSQALQKHAKSRPNGIQNSQKWQHIRQLDTEKNTQTATKSATVSK